MLLEEHMVDWMGSNEFEAGQALRGKRVRGTLGKGGELVGCVPACKVVAPVRADLGPEPIVAKSDQGRTY